MIVGVIGGSGLYELFESGEADAAAIETPYGSTSSGVMAGSFGDRNVAFLTRHGTAHSLPPHAINYRANVWALASLGVSAIVSFSAVGSISPAIAPGAFVIPDQIIDRTWGRADTFFDGTAASERIVQHLPFADPYCAQLRSIAIDALTDVGEKVVPRGTTVVIQGPRFSTRAESRWLRSVGGDIVNMTQYPEAALAAELNIGMVNLSFVTDTDAGEASAGDTGSTAVNAAEVFERMAAAKPRILAAIAAIVAAVPVDYAPRELIDPTAVEHVLMSTSMPTLKAL